ncbi:MAG: hypothetical protein AB4426_16560 [Xenococcaceae cyanobacterium]
MITYCFPSLIYRFALIYLTVFLWLGLPTSLNAAPINSASCPEDMAFIPGVTFNIGSDTH